MNFAQQTANADARTVRPDAAALTLGILGGGQLARMSAYAALRLGIQVAVYSDTARSPAGDIAHYTFSPETDGSDALRRFADCCDVITLENEFIDVAVLAALEKSGQSGQSGQSGKPVYPSAATISLVRDKLIQKQTLRAHHLPTADFSAIASPEDARDFGASHGYPFLLKARCNGYDGYGNRTVRALSDIEPAMQALGFPTRELLAEAFVDFRAELATIVARTRSGSVQLYPVVETVQENHICKIVKAPAPVEEGVRAAASRLAQAAIEAVGGVGVFGVEMFLTKDSRVLLNELAPRPHNSGHYSIEACVTSQFENHVRAVFGWGLGSPAMLVPAAVMVNILGKRNAPLSLGTLGAALQSPVAKLHLYGKAESRIGRKLGHITVLGDTLTACLSEGLALDERLVL